jgi:RIO kinase 2
MKLDARDLRYVSTDEFKVLSAVSLIPRVCGRGHRTDREQVETGSRNHEVVPTPLIAEISGVRGGNVNKALGELAKRNLVARVQNAKCTSHFGLCKCRRPCADWVDDGYRLTYGGLDWLALRAFTKRKPSTVASVGTRIGVGKEADVYMVADDNSENRILKLQRYVNCW